MSGENRISNYRRLARRIAYGVILLAGLAAGSHWHRAAKGDDPSLLGKTVALSPRAEQPPFTIAPPLAPQPLTPVHSKRLTPAPGSGAYALPHAAAPSPSLSALARAQAMKVFAGLPMMFEANNGQTDPRVKFLARAPGYTLFLTDKEAVLALAATSPVVSSPHPGRHAQNSSLPRLMASRPTRAVRLRFAGASAPTAITGQDQLPGKTNYFIGDDRKQWRTNVPNYSAVEYRGIYPGVDAIFRGDNRQLEFDFDVAPGADPRTIALEVQGARRMRVNSAGDVLLRLGGKRDVLLGKPHIYQQTPQGRREIAGHYVLGARNRITFALSSYDHSQPLVIDPTLEYSTYLGGSVQDSPYGIAADSSGSAYITGVSYSANFPVTSGVYQTSCLLPGKTNCSAGTAFVTKFTPDGSSLVYSTFLNGHTGGDLGTGIAVDSSGAAYVLGVEQGELDFPTTTGAIQAPCNIAANLKPEVFVAKLDPSGSNLVYSTCLQNPEVNASSSFSQGSSFPGGIAVDDNGNAYVTGSTDLPESFPTTQTSFETTCQLNSAGGCSVSEDPFVVKINSTGTVLLYSTFLSGGAFGSQVTSNGIAVDSFGDAYVIGYDNDVGAYPPGSPGGLLTTPGSYVSNCPNFSCGGFLAKINANATVLAYSTYLANVSLDITPTAVAVDQSGNAYVTGYTASTDFPATQGVLQFTFTPFGSPTTNLEDGFVIKMDQLGHAYAYGTFLGGTASNTIPTGIAVDYSGHVFVTGTTAPGFPTTASAFQTTDQAGANQVFFSELDPIGASLLYSTFLAGTTGEAFDTEPVATGVSYLATDASGNAYVTGQTDSTNFPTTPGAFQTNSPLAGGSQATTGFVAKFVFVDSALSISPTTLTAGTAGVPYGPVTLTATGGTGTDTFALTAGSLPPNLALSSAGVLSGTPTRTNTFSFTITATDSIGDTNSQTYTLQIGCPTIIVGPSTLASGTNGTAYPPVTFTETGGVGTTTFSETGALPTGMTFVAGVLGGTPTQTESFPITVTATDSNGCIGTTSLTLTINPSTGSAASIRATAGTPQSAPINMAFATALQATVTDSGGNPVSGVTVTFVAPTSGATGTFANGTASTTATTGASGQAAATTFTANGTAGAYTVTATVAGVTTAANFSLTNNSSTGPSPAMVMDNETITVTDTPTFPDIVDSERITVTDTVMVSVSGGVKPSATTTAISSASASFDGFTLPASFALVGTTQVSVSFTVKPAAVGATPTGSVTVTDSFNDSCSATLGSTSAGAGSCSLTISQVGSGSTSLTAAYAPDANATSNGLLASTSTVFTENVVQIVSCGGSAPPATISQGSTGTSSFMVCLAGDVNAVPTAITANCLTFATCTLTVTAVPGKTGAYNVTLSIATNAGTVPLQNAPSSIKPWPVALLALSMLLFLCMAFLLARHRGGRLRLVYAAGLLLALTVGGISGCTSASTPGSPNNIGTPVGAFTINVKVMAGNFDVTVPVSVTVTN